MTQVNNSVEQPNISVKRKKFDPESGSGYLEVIVNGSLYTFKVYRKRQGKGLIVEFDGLYEVLSRLRKLLKHKGLGDYADLIEQHIRSMVYEAEVKSAKRHKILLVRSVQVGSEKVEVGLRDDGKIVLKVGGKRVFADSRNITNELTNVLPLDYWQTEVVQQIKGALAGIAENVITGREIVVVADNEETYMLLLSAVVDDKLLVLIPFVSTYTDGVETKRGLLVASIIADRGGNVERVELSPNPVEVEVSGRVVRKDFLDRINLSDAIERILPSASLVNRIRAEINSGRSVKWSEAIRLVEEIIDKYAYVEGRSKRLAVLYAIAQVFYDLIPIFPILRIIGEMGSGKRLLSNSIAACAAIAVTVVKPSEAALYRLADAFHPLLIIDESKINEDVSLLLNAGYEKDKFVSRARTTEEGRVTIDLFNFYSPKIIISRPGKLNLPDDTISRTIEVYMERVTDKVFPPEVDPRDKEEAVTKLLLLKVKKWHEFLSTYTLLRNEMINIDPRTRDTYLPLLTIAYLVSKERGDPSFFAKVLSDMVETFEERAGTPYHQKMTITGILKYIATTPILTGTVKAISITVKDIVKDIESSLGSRIDVDTKVKIGRFLNEAPFKVSKSRSGGYTKYLIDVEKLYSYVKNYNADISLLTDDELDSLERATGLNWRGTGFNKDDWIKRAVARLFEEKPSTPSPQRTCAR